MTGDLFSSFIKRRFGSAPSSQALGLDQIPESLLPLVACSFILPISIADIFMVLRSFSSVNFCYPDCFSNCAFAIIRIDGT